MRGDGFMEFNIMWDIEKVKRGAAILHSSLLTEPAAGGPNSSLVLEPAAGGLNSSF